MEMQKVQKTKRASYKIVSVLTAFVMVASLFGYIPVVFAAGNLFLNPNLEDSATGTSPDNWSFGSFGTNDATTTYPVEGPAGVGDKAALVTITTLTDGDAKWYPQAVPVSANQKYVFKDSYKSDVVTSIVLQFELADGSYYYLDLAAFQAASPTWSNVQLSFTVPDLDVVASPVVSVTTFHRLAAVGSLAIDNMNLFQILPTVITDMVPNNSVEEVSNIDNALPAAWNHGGLGNNTRTFEYMNEGHDGGRSVKVTVSNYVDGDAKWIYDAQPMPTVNDYRFRGWYKTDTNTKVVAQFIRADSTEYFFGMPNPEPTGLDWQEYTGEFSVPSDAVKVSVFFFVTGNGFVQVDDFHIFPYDYTGFTKPIVTLSFDDGVEENITTVLPLVNSLGLKTTQCYETATVEGDVTQTANVLQFFNTGHEICAHTVTHPFLSQSTPTQVDFELSHSQTVLEGITGQPVTTFASPYGDYNTAVVNQIKNYFASHRTVNEGYNSADNFDVYRLRVQNMHPQTTLAQFQGWVNKAIADKTWLILVYHKVATTNLEPFDTLTTDFNDQMNWLATQTSNIDVLRWDEALSFITTPPVPLPSTPVATPDSSSFASSVSVTLASTNSTSIRYSLDSSEPTCSVGTLYTAAIDLNTTTAIKAIGCNSTGPSPVAVFTYTLETPPPTPTPTPSPTPTPTPGPTPTPTPGGGGGGSGGSNIGTINGTVFNDANSNGTLDAGEIGINNITVYLDSNNNATREAVEVFTSTNAAGNYGWSNLSIATYNIRVVIPQGSTLTMPTSTDEYKYVVALSNNSSVASDKHFGITGQVLGEATTSPTKSPTPTPAPSPTPSPTPTPIPTNCTPYVTRTLSVGMRNAEVLKLQQFLNLYEGNKMPTTGYFGSITRTKVKAFQLKYKDEILAPLRLTKPTGVVGPMTRQKINSLVCQNPK